MHAVVGFAALTVALAIVFEIESRLGATQSRRPTAPTGVVAFLIGAFVVVAPTLWPARQVLRPLTETEEGQPIAAFIVLASSVGVAVTALCAATLLRYLTIRLVKMLVLLTRLLVSLWRRSEPAASELAAPAQSASGPSAPRDKDADPSATADPSRFSRSSS